MIISVSWSHTNPACEAMLASCCAYAEQVPRRIRHASEFCVAVAGGMVEIFLFIIASGLIAHFIGAGVHEGIFVGALVRTAAEPC